MFYLVFVYLDIFLAALKLLKSPPTDRVVVVGDTPWDAQGKINILNLT